MSGNSKTVVLHHAPTVDTETGDKRVFRNITAKEREQMLMAWNRDKGRNSLNSSLSLELTREQQSQLKEQLSTAQYNKLIKGNIQNS